MTYDSVKIIEIRLNMSGGASFNSSFEVTPMREPIQKTKGKNFHMIIRKNFIRFTNIL